MEGVVLVFICNVVIQHNKAFLPGFRYPLNARIDAHVFRQVVVLQQGNPVQVRGKGDLRVKAGQAGNKAALWQLNIGPVVIQGHGKIAGLVPGELCADFLLFTIVEVTSFIGDFAGKFTLATGR